MPPKRDMPLRCPALVIHHQAGKEYWAEQEVGDTLFPRDPKIEIKHTEYRGILLVYTEINPLEAYRLLRSQVLTSIDRVVPLRNCIHIRDDQPGVTLLGWLCKELRNTVAGLSCFKLHVSLRGELKKRVKLRDLESCVEQRQTRDCAYGIHVGSLGDLLYIGMAPE